MLRMIFLCLTVIILTSCKKDDESSTIPSCPEGTCSFIYFQNSSLDTSKSNVEIVKGSKIVFKYNFKANDNPNIADDEYSESILLEADANATEFQFEDEEITKSKIYYSQHCFCSERGILPIKHGYIKGIKLGENLWKIDFEIVVGKNEKEIKISEEFKKVVE